MQSKILVKHKKELLKAVRGTDLLCVKKLVEEIGVDPNERIHVMKYVRQMGKMPWPENAYLNAIEKQVELLEKQDESKNADEQKMQLEIVKYLTPKINSVEAPYKNGTTYIWAGFMHPCKGIGLLDELLMAMIDSGYDIKTDKSIYRAIGRFSLPVVQKVIEKIGHDDGHYSVHSAAMNCNWEVLYYFIDQKVPLNQPFLFDNGAREYILHHTIWHNPNEVEPVKRLIENGAPVNVRNFQGLNCMDIAIKRKASQEIIELLT